MPLGTNHITQLHKKFKMPIVKKVIANNDTGVRLSAATNGNRRLRRLTPQDQLSKIKLKLAFLSFVSNA